MEIDELRQIVGEIEEYLQLFNDEYSEYLENLCGMVNRTYCMSEEFEKLYCVELKANLERLKNETIIEEVVVNPEPYTQKVLVWHDGY
jgi:hypothetical protein